MAKWMKPTVDTKFHLDFEWWDRRNLDFRLELRSQLCEACRSQYPDHKNTQLIDWVDPDTARVERVDPLWQSLEICCRDQADYISEYTPLTTAVFRTFLANGNTPLSPKELHEQLGRRTPRLILSTIGGRRVYHGIRPVDS